MSVTNLLPGMTQAGEARKTERAVWRLHHEADWPTGAIASELGPHRDSVKRIINRLKKKQGTT